MAYAARKDETTFTMVTEVSEIEEATSAGALEIPSVTWWKDAGLLKLYIMIPILFLGSTTNGYDGSLLNGLQTLDPWQDCWSPAYYLHRSSKMLT